MRLKDVEPVKYVPDPVDGDEVDEDADEINEDDM